MISLKNMKIIDVIFALIGGRIISFLVNDFLKGAGIQLGPYYYFISWLAFPFFTLFCLWAAYQIGRRFLFIFQAAKHVLVGAVVTVVDLKIFEILLWIVGLFTASGSLVIKGVSFIAATILKYFGNKYWAFNKPEKENLSKEIIQFLFITLMGLVLDVASFYYLTEIMAPQFELSHSSWIKASVVLAAFTAALWNFLGYKFLVFKK